MCETIKIKFDDGDEHYYPDISYDNFVKYLFESGSSDCEYFKYLDKHNMNILSDYNSESTSEITLIVEDSCRERVLKFRCIYDSDNDSAFNPIEYFNDGETGV